MLEIELAALDPETARACLDKLEKEGWARFCECLHAEGNVGPVLLFDPKREPKGDRQAQEERVGNILRRLVASAKPLVPAPKPEEKPKRG
ncbi:hypothetical protein BH11ARM2_BH11ARM2_27320 [soil metagenome]